jgi:hypothetical protein
MHATKKKNNSSIMTQYEIKIHTSSTQVSVRLSESEKWQSPGTVRQWRAGQRGPAAA